MLFCFDFSFEIVYQQLSHSHWVAVKPFRRRRREIVISR